MPMSMVVQISINKSFSANDFQCVEKASFLDSVQHLEILLMATNFLASEKIQSKTEILLVSYWSFIQEWESGHLNLHHQRLFLAHLELTQSSYLNFLNIEKRNSLNFFITFLYTSFSWCKFTSMDLMITRHSNTYCIRDQNQGEMEMREHFGAFELEMTVLYFQIYGLLLVTSTPKELFKTHRYQLRKNKDFLDYGSQSHST